MSEQFGEKSQDATPHRRQQAREQGQVAKSQDLSSAIMLLGALLSMAYWGEGIVNFMGELAQRQLGSLASVQTDPQTIARQWQQVTGDLATALLPIFVTMFILGIAVNVGQIGFLFLPNKLGFDVSRINPAKGAGRLFSIASVVRLSLGILKILIVSAVAMWSLWSHRDMILSLSSLEVSQIGVYIIEITFWTCLKIGIALLILAILDYAYQKWKFEQELMMTNQEVREEMKNLQGDPQVIARRRAVQRQMALNRLNNAVPDADVVVTNPTELAIAIKYDYETMPAPVVVSKGAGVLAQRIRRLALENNIPIVERKELAQALYKHVDVNQSVPTEQYAAVAEVLRYVYDLQGKTIPGMSDAA